MVVLSQRIYPQNGAAGQNSCFESKEKLQIDIISVDLNKSSQSYCRLKKGDFGRFALELNFVALTNF